MMLSDDQLTAFHQIKAFLKNPDSQEFVLAGLAGTGKTTLIKALLDEPDTEPHHVMALAGKAASVLRSKGVHATTIHSHIYSPPGEGFTAWHLRPGDEVDGSFFVVDEASMVSTDLYRDIKSFGRKVLWVGDHGQLEPIGDNPRLMEKADVRLEKIHRQAEGSPIIAFSHALRIGRRFKERDTEALVLAKAPRNKLIDHILEEQPDQVIVGFNTTRHIINKAYRDRMSLKGKLVPGDRVICLKNNREVGVFNGMQGTVVRINTENDRYIWCDVQISGDQTLANVKMAKVTLGEDLPPNARIKDRDTTVWDYAYAITCHKSQGSEWPRVFVYEQLVDGWSPERWSYTAATRASQRLVYVSRRCE